MTTATSNSLLALRRPGLHLRTFSRFIRAAALGATIVMPLTGAVTALDPVTARHAIGLVVAGAAFHMYGYVLNDVVDLPIDRTEPRRRGAPLVEGTVSRRFALVFALVNVPLAVLTTWWLGAPAPAYTTLAVAIVGAAAYDLWGKRCRAPIIMDVVQGVSWAAFCWYGAAVVGGITPATALLGCFFVVYIMMANGVHGGLRDISNDHLHGARTTPIAFGVEPLQNGGVVLTPAFRRYAYTLQLALVALSVALLAGLRIQGLTMAYGATMWALTSGAAVVLLFSAMRAAERRADLMVRGTLHLIVALGVVIAVLAPVMPWSLRFAAVAVYVTPLLTYGWLLDAVRRVADPRDPR